MNLEKRLQDLEEAIKGNPVKNVWGMGINDTSTHILFKKIKDEKLTNVEKPSVLDQKLASMSDGERAVYLTDLARRNAIL